MTEVDETDCRENVARNMEHLKAHYDTCFKEVGDTIIANEAKVENETITEEEQKALDRARKALLELDKEKKEMVAKANQVFFDHHPGKPF